jgi:hypothetical protein
MLNVGNERQASADVALIGLLPEAVRLERLDDALNHVRELEERWNNRLSIKRLSLAERYREGYHS